ncbi:hypothetical protein CHS0354_022032 [Potamilus streckersoni]|uniref:Sema domain-containing protein n=1 Tax=Potamilus streckersoni TaxID=2493646 RepID=A0AAE0T1V5_9BIVA|nr:hypothetical protein CHS0354_022032 [Potamilus streckersoni]
MWRFIGLLLFAVLWVGDGESSPKVTKKQKDIKTLMTYNETNCKSSTCYYRYLVPDEEEKRLYVGAMNYIIVLNLDNISNLIQKKELMPDKGQEKICSIQVREVPDCQNHIRLITKLPANRLMVCGTGAYSPQKYDLNVANLNESSNPSSGVGLCPFDPFDNATSIYVTNDNPSNIPSHYTGTYTNFVKTFPVIYRPQLMDGSTVVVSTVISEKDNENWLKSPQFVASFDLAREVYFFFREEAVEFQNCEEKKIVSRVAKVCKKDMGSDMSQRYWLSYQKARLLCTVPGFNPDYFDDIQDVSYVKEDDVFYALFTKIAQGVKASAICAYKKQAVVDVFAGKYKYKDNGLWKELPKNLEPKPRSVDCSIYEDANITLSSDQTEYVKYQLMNDEVEPTNGQPMFYSSNLILNKIITVFNITGKRDTLFLVSSNDGYIYKILLDNTANPPKSVVLTQYEVYPDRRQIWSIKLVNDTLYVGSDKSVDQFKLDDCDYTTIDVCGEDPYCVWCGLCSGSCVSAKQASSCSESFRISDVPSGMKVHQYLTDVRRCRLYSNQTQFAINDTYSILKIQYRLTVSGPVQWQLNNVDVNIGEDFLLSTDNSLVIKNLTKSKEGLYTALEVSDGTERQIASYNITVGK